MPSYRCPYFYLHPLNLHSHLSVCVQGLDVDDIAEIRPGRVSFSCDGTSHMPSLTIVGSETCITLPLDSVAIRNALLRQFQSFLMVSEGSKNSPPLCLCF
jgi:hypothetical protein